MGHGHIGTEHLLLGLIGATGTTVSDALIGAGAFLLPAREKVIEALSNRSLTATGRSGADLPYSDRAARALDRSGRLSLRMGGEQVRCEHILLSVLDVEGTAGQVLRGLGVDPEAVRQAVTATMSTPSPPEAPREAPASGEGPERRPPRAEPICGACGSSLATSVDRATLKVAGGSPDDQVDVYFCNVCGTAIGAQRR